jgi:hypothetical protein
MRASPLLILVTDIYLHKFRKKRTYRTYRTRYGLDDKGWKEKQHELPFHLSSPVG